MQGWTPHQGPVQWSRDTLEASIDYGFLIHAVGTPNTAVAACLRHLRRGLLQLARKRF